MAVNQTIGGIFAERMRELRLQRGFTQAELAARCGFPQARISELERGANAPNLVTIARLAVALECKVTSLVAPLDKEDLASMLSD